MPSRFVTVPVYISPVLLGYVLVETGLHNAYPPEEDSIGIPLLTYILLYFPIAMYFAAKIEAGTLSKPTIKLWNRRRPMLSFFSLLFSVFPLGLFWFAFAVTSLTSRSYASLATCLVMLIITGAVRTYAIQDYEDAAGASCPSES